MNVSCNVQGSKISNSTAPRDSTVILKGNQIISIDGFDVSKYELKIDYLEFVFKELTIGHILCVAVLECDLEMSQKLIQNRANPNMISDADHIIFY